jgi:hypothetical protein
MKETPPHRRPSPGVWDWDHPWHGFPPQPILPRLFQSGLVEKAGRFWVSIPRRVNSEQSPIGQLAQFTRDRSITWRSAVSTHDIAVGCGYCPIGKSPVPQNRDFFARTPKLTNTPANRPTQIVPGAASLKAREAPPWLFELQTASITAFAKGSPSRVSPSAMEAPITTYSGESNRTTKPAGALPFTWLTGTMMASG